MQKISGTSFKGTEPKQKPENPINTSSQTVKELGAGALPACDKSLAIAPSLPSDFLNESDLARYKKVQVEWAKSFAQRYNIPFENVIARLPEIKIIETDKNKGHLTKNLESFVLGGFSFKTDTVEMNPVREISNLYGGDEARVVHETVHGFFHHLRRDYVEQLTVADLSKKASGAINAKILDGEMGYTLSANADNPKVVKVVKIPILSSRERKELMKFMATLNRKEHLDENPLRLNKAGITVLKEKLLPILTDYAQTVVAASENKEDRICEEIAEYINAAFYRKGLVIAKCKAGKPREGLFLTKIEQEMASKSIEQLSELIEGTHLSLESKLPGSNKAYFMSPEELLARKESSIFRLERLNQKIKDIEATGIKPSATLLNEQEMLQSNIRLVDLAENISDIEKQMIASEKQTEEIKRINIRRGEGAKILKVKNADELSELLKTKNGWNKIVAGIKVAILWGTDRPEQLLADTNKNRALKEHFDDLVQQIKALSTNSDLTAIPARFTKINIRVICRKLMDSAILGYWLKRLK